MVGITRDLPLVEGETIHQCCDVRWIEFNRELWTQLCIPVLTEEHVNRTSDSGR